MEDEISKIATAHEAAAIDDQDLETEIADRDRENGIEGPDRVIGGPDPEIEIGIGEIKGVGRVTDVVTEEDRVLEIDVRQEIEIDHATGQPETTKKTQEITLRGRTKNEERYAVTSRYLLLMVLFQSASRSPSSSRQSNPSSSPEKSPSRQRRYVHRLTLFEKQLCFICIFQVF